MHASKFVQTRKHADGHSQDPELGETTHGIYKLYTVNLVIAVQVPERSHAVSPCTSISLRKCNHYFG